MARYKCEMCGWVYDEAEKGVKFADLPEDYKCVCGAPKELFKLMAEDVAGAAAPSEAGGGGSGVGGGSGGGLGGSEQYIMELASTGEMPAGAGPTVKALPSWDDVWWLAGQVATPPLLDDAKVNLKTVIGARAKRPMELAMPVTISHMSYGALTGEAKVTLAKGAAAVGTAMSSGEGGIYEAEIKAAQAGGKYIFEYVPNMYSVTDENLKRVDAVEIKIGQAAKPGLGGHLPAAKVTEEIAKMRGKPMGKDIISPARFERLLAKGGLKKLVEELREKSGGRPIGVKIAANHIEKDLAVIIAADADFVTIDGRGGSTGSAPVGLKDAAGVPILYAVLRAAKYIREQEAEIDLIVTGGFRLPSEMAKALALGADAVAVATAGLIAMGAPGELASEKKVENYLAAVGKEIAMFTRVTGKDDVAELGAMDVEVVGAVKEYVG